MIKNVEDNVVFLTLKVFNSDNFSIGSYNDELGHCHLGMEGNQGAETSCVCLYQKSVCKDYRTVCKAVRLAFSCQTSAISFPFIPIPCRGTSNYA